MKEDARNMNDQPDRFELFTLAAGEEKYATPYSAAPFYCYLFFLEDRFF